MFQGLGQEVDKSWGFKYKGYFKEFRKIGDFTVHLSDFRLECNFKQGEIHTITNYYRNEKFIGKYFATINTLEPKCGQYINNDLLDFITISQSNRIHYMDTYDYYQYTRHIKPHHFQTNLNFGLAYHDNHPRSAYHAGNSYEAQTAYSPHNAYQGHHNITHAYHDMDPARYNHGNSAHYNHVNSAHYNHVNSAHYNDVNSAHYNHVNSAHYNHVNSAHYNHVNSAHYNHFNSIHHKHANSAHYNHFNSAHFKKKILPDTKNWLNYEKSELLKIRKVPDKQKFEETKKFQKNRQICLTTSKSTTNSRVVAKCHFLASDEVYIGEMDQDSRHGLGIFHKVGDFFYRGYWKNNKFHGKGEIFKENLKISGLWESGNLVFIYNTVKYQLP